MKKILFSIQQLLTLFIFIGVFTACSTDNTSTSSTNPTKSGSKTDQSSTKPAASKSTKKNIVFFGNSLSAGYGLDPGQGFVGLIEDRVDSLNLDYKVINAGNSGETTSGGKERISWILDNYPIDIFVLELGGNDALRGLPVADAEKNLQSIINQVKTKYPKVKIVLAGMMAPPNMGNKYTTEFAAIYPRLAKHNNAALIPFLLDKVGGEPTLNLPDGIHPNIEGHKIVRETVWETLKTII